MVTFFLSERLKDAVYGLPWECMDTRNRRTVAFFLMNVQEPVHVKALALCLSDITSPADYPYLILLRHLLSVVSSWPPKLLDLHDTGAIRRRKIWMTIQKTFHMIERLTSICSSVTYILLHKSKMTFVELGHLYICLFITISVFFRITTLCFSDEYVVVARNFLEKMHLFHYKDRSEYCMKIHKKVHMISHVITLCITVQMVAGLSLFNIIPIYNNYSAGKFASGGLKGNATYEHALYYAYPFPVSTDLDWYIFSNFIAWLESFLCSTWLCMHDCFLSLMVFHIWGHFKILLYNLDNFPRPSSKTSFIIEESHATLSYEMFSPHELKSVSVQLTELIEYHRNIIKFTDKMTEVFGPMLLAYYGFHQASGCLLLLECSQMTAAALARYLPLTFIVFQQLIQLSIIFELIGSVSERLKDAVYGLPWECMDTRNRRTVAFFLMNVQEPVHVKAMGLADVGVTTMTKILKTSMSYFAFLKSK